MQRVPCRFFCMHCFFSTSSLPLCYLKKIKKTVNPFCSPKNDGSEDPVRITAWLCACGHSCANTMRRLRGESARSWHQGCLSH